MGAGHLLEWSFPNLNPNLNLNPDFPTRIAGLIKTEKEIKIRIKIKSKIPI